MIPDYNEKVYNLLIEVVKLNFKPQIKGSGIVLRKIFKVINLETREEGYFLSIDNTSIQFKTAIEFVDRFIAHISNNLSKFNEQYKDLRKREQETIVDEYAIFDEDEYIGVCSDKQLKLLKKMRELKKTLS